MILGGVIPDISVVVPAHNESANLPTLIGEIDAALQPLGRSRELIIVDDQSSDATPQVLRDLQPRYPGLRVLRMVRRGGQSAALAAGFDEARGAIIVTLDADLQNDPADIPRLLELLRTHDAAVGWRRNRKDTLRKRIISKFANRIRNWATGECVKDTGCGLKAFRRAALARIPRFDGMHRFFPTLVKMHGYTVAETPVNHRPRQHGKTHYNIFNRSLRPICDLLAVRWLQRRTLRYEVEKEMLRARTAA